MLIDSRIEEIIDRALAEDLALGDVTTGALISGEQLGGGSIMVKEAGILAGVEVAKHVFQRLDPELKVDILFEDGSKVKPGDVVARVEGKIASMLEVERLALNSLQRLSGIASETNRYVEAVKGLPVRITDTRKTTPGLRSLEKYAVRLGGGQNHRMSLADGILIKDNHLAALSSQGLTFREVIEKARQNTSIGQKIEVEAKTVPEAMEAADAGVDIVMLDNMGLEDMRQAVRAIHGRVLVEASGGVTLDRVRAIAETGVDFISVGALTHSAKALDISLEITT